MNGNHREKELKTSAVVLPGIITTAQKLGIDIGGILHRLGITLDLDHITRSTISLKQVHAIVMAVEQAAGHPAIGLHTGEDFDFEFLPHLKTFLMSASTIREAFEATRPMQQLVSSLLSLKLEETGKEAVIRLAPDQTLAEEDERHYVEMVFACIKTLVNRLMRATVPPLAVHFRHSRAEITPLYADFFGGAIVLNAAENAMLYDRAILDVPLPGGFPEIRRQAGKIVHRQLDDSPLSGGLAEDLKRLMAARTDLLQAPVAQVARALGMSGRTLQRRLAEDSQSLAGLRDEVRYQLAVRALQSGRLSIDEIGAQLGFSDRHSFTRAFKRWSGRTPSAYRRHPSPSEAI